MRTFLTLLLSLTTLAAGCVGTDPEPAAPAATAQADGDAPSTAPTASAPPDVGTAATTSDPQEAARLVELETPFGYDAQLGTWATVCHEALPIMCVGQTVAPGENSLAELGFVGKVTSVEVTATWTAPTPATQTLRLVLAYGPRCGGDCVEVTGAVAVEGTSPLTLSAPDLADEGIEIMYLSLEEPHPDLPVRYWASIDQAARLEGVVSTLVAG